MKDIAHTVPNKPKAGHSGVIAQKDGQIGHLKVYFLP